MSLRVESKEGQISISASVPNPFSKIRLFRGRSPNPEPEIKPAGSEIQVSKNGTGGIFGRFRRQSIVGQVVTDPRVEVRDHLLEEFQQTDKTIERVLLPSIAIFGTAAAIFTAAASLLRPPVVEISSPAIPTEDPKPTTDLSGSLPAGQHIPFFNLAQVIEEIDLNQQRLHPELAPAPKVEIPSAQIEPEEPKSPPAMEDKKLTDEEIIKKVVPGQPQFANLLKKMKENGEDHPSSERMIEMFRLNFLDKVDAFKASANGIINNPYEYPDKNMQRKAREQLAAIDYLLKAYEEGRELAFDIEFEKLRRAKNYSAPPPEEPQHYAQAA